MSLEVTLFYVGSYVFEFPLHFKVQIHTIFLVFVWTKRFSGITFKNFYWWTLTRLTWLIHILFLPSNWNLGKNFALTGELGQVHMEKKYFQFSSMQEDGYFCYWICDFFCETPPFYEVKWIRRKLLPHGGISKIFFLDHFSPSFLGQKWYLWIQIPFWV